MHQWPPAAGAEAAAAAAAVAEVTVVVAAAGAAVEVVVASIPVADAYIPPMMNINRASGNKTFGKPAWLPAGPAADTD